MWWRRKTLALLHEELRTLALFDRVHDYAIDPDPADNGAYASRQIRRSQIMAEISRAESIQTGVQEPRSNR